MGIIVAEGFEVRTDDDGWTGVMGRYRQLLPQLKQVSPTKVIEDAESGECFWVIPPEDFIATVAAETGEWKMENDKFPPGTMVKYNNQRADDEDSYGLVLKRITVNGWYIVLNDNGKHDLTGNAMMEVVSETTLG